MAANDHAVQYVNVPSSHVCHVCHLPYENPVIVRPCRHTCCYTCLLETQPGRALTECPICGGSFGSSVPALWLHAELLDAMVHCAWDGCELQMKQGELQQHAQECAFGVGVCPHKGCRKKAQRRYIEAHAAVCGWGVVACPKRCGIDVERRVLERHLQLSCAKREVQCQQCGTKRKAEAEARHCQRYCPRRDFRKLEDKLAGPKQSARWVAPWTDHHERVYSDEMTLHHADPAPWKDHLGRVYSDEMTLHHADPRVRYTFVLVMCPGGNGGRGVGLHFLLRRGPDAKSLDWPLARKVEVRLVGRRGKRDKVRILDPKTSPNAEYFARMAPPPPEHSKKLGWKEFLAPDDGIGAYIKNNTVEVQVRLLDDAP
eukprot:TRINITY_DN8657_c1_g1_i3.p1 TRINITY_DN8657_c1_g1~~TRINITY_DN8657_c1_g1_i3.p1  ORF type:complete len:371 (+),score=71.30 TRINITY_DN8657_c1_g1_i3:61-1173(+)